MNQKDALRNVARNRSLFKLGSARNVIKLNANNTEMHEMAKAHVCWALLQAGHEFLTEAEFRGGRADVVDLTDGVIIEILHSEKVENLSKKAQVYPLPIRYVHSDMAALFSFKLEALQVV